MSVILTLRVQGDPGGFEEIATQDPSAIRSITDNAKQHGLWENEQGRIGPLMQQAGITAQPEVTFWRRLETKDDVGWDG